MPYGILKVDTITFTDNSVDKTISLSGLVQNPTFTGNVTATGTISGNIIKGGTTISGTTVAGTTANFVSGVFTNLEITTSGSLSFEGSTADSFETFLNVVDPTADRTITLPDSTGTVALLSLAQSFSAAQRGAISALTDGATITADFALANNFSVTLGGSRTLANPSNQTAGQSGCIWITQDGTGSRTLAYGSQWDFTGGTAPTLSTAAAAVDCLVYAVQSSTKITATLITNLS